MNRKCTTYFVSLYLYPRVSKKIQYYHPPVLCVIWFHRGIVFLFFFHFGFFFLRHDICLRKTRLFCQLMLLAHEHKTLMFLFPRYFSSKSKFFFSTWFLGILIKPVRTVWPRKTPQINDFLSCFFMTEIKGSIQMVCTFNKEIRARIKAKRNSKLCYLWNGGEKKWSFNFSNKSISSSLLYFCILYLPKYFISQNHLRLAIIEYKLQTYLIYQDSIVILQNESYQLSRLFENE